MSERFLELSLERRRSFLDEAGIALKRSPVILEKDIWVCWALEVLFSLEQPVMVFKASRKSTKPSSAFLKTLTSPLTIARAVIPCFTRLAQVAISAKSLATA